MTRVSRRLLASLVLVVALTVGCGDEMAASRSSPNTLSSIAAPSPLDESVGDGRVAWPPDLDGFTPLSDCPEALAFWQRADVQAFYAEHFGRPPGPNDRYAGGCPDVALMEKEYQAAMEQVGVRP